MSSEDQTLQDTPEHIVKFSDFDLSPFILKAVEELGYETPSPIQEKSIPILTNGQDLLGVAQTGTGKTAAFALPLLGKVDPKNLNPQILCLAPTRELAIQVSEAFQKYAHYLKGFHVIPIYGGANIVTQMKQLQRGAQVIVGTPGRVMDLMRRKNLNLEHLKALILDEADEMLSMGFVDDIEWILDQMPGGHQTALFSATMPTQIRRLTEKYMNDPQQVTIKSKTATASTVRQRYVPVSRELKLDALTRILENENTDGIIMFARTKTMTTQLAESLQARGFAAEALNGDLTQKLREQTVEKLRSGRIDIVVATDVAARGLDVKRISHVINYDIPTDSETYVHRIGRTGRAGRQGDAILFISGRENRLLQQIERDVQVRMDKYEFPTADDINQRKANELYSKIDKALTEDLSEYESLMMTYLHDKSPDNVKLYAAMARLIAGDKKFFVSEVPDFSRGANRDSGDESGGRGRGPRRGGYAGGGGSGYRGGNGGGGYRGGNAGGDRKRSGGGGSGSPFRKSGGTSGPNAGGGSGAGGKRKKSRRDSDWN